MRNILNRLSIASVVLLILSLTSCSSFNLVDLNSKPAGSSIAVICGINNDANVALATVMTESLQNKTSFKVLSQKQVADAVPNYPTRITGPYKYAYMQIDEDYTRTDIEKLKDYYKKLKVKYMLVIWVPILTTVKTTSQYGTSIDEQLHTITQLYEFPEGKEVGNAKNIISKYDGTTYVGSNKGTKKDIMMMYCDRLVKDLAEKMKIGK